VILSLDESSAQVLLGAAREVATAGGSAPLSDPSAEAIASMARLALGCLPPDTDRTGPVRPGQLAAALGGPDEAVTAAELLGVVSLVDGSLDRGRIDQVLAFASALEVGDHWLDDLARSLEPDLGPVIADMGDRNLRSVTDGRLGMADIDDINRWLMPYDGDGADEALAARYRALADEPPGSFGHGLSSGSRRHGRRHHDMHVSVVFVV